MNGPRFVLRPSDVDPAEAALADDLLLRVCVVAVGVSAILALPLVDLLDPRIALIDVLLTVACSAFARWTLARPRLRWARLAGWLVVGGVSLVNALLSPLGDDPRVLLGMLVAGFVAATAAEQDGSRRSMLVNLALGLAVLALAAGVAPSASLAGPMAVGWVGAVTALLRAGPRRERLGTAGALRPIPGVGGRSPLWRTLVVPLVACVGVGLLAFAVLHQLRSPSQAGADGSGPFGQPGATLEGGNDTRLSSVYSADAMDLRQRGALSERALLEVPTDSPTLWRTGMLDLYTGSGWQSARTGGATLLGQGRVSVPQDAADPRPAVPAGAPTRTETNGGTRTDVVLVLDPAVGAIAAPGVVTQVLLPDELGLVRLPDGRLMAVTGPVDPTQSSPSTQSTQSSQSSQSSGTPRIASLDSYVVSTVPRASVDRAAAAGSSSGDPGDPRWRQLPEHLPARVAELARQLASTSAGDRRSAVLAVEDDLRARARYTLDSPVPDDGADAVDDFLFVSREGFCEQFASAEVVLLRSMGIPARLVVGFSGGEVLSAGDRLIRGTDAHAWVEVWLPGSGWVTSDPTAGAVPVEASPAERLRAWLAQWWPVLVAVLAVLLLALVVSVVLVRRRRRRRATAGPDGEPAGRSALPGAAQLVAAYGRLEAVLAAAGAARRPDESLTALGRRKALAPVRGALDTLQRLTFAARPPELQECLDGAAALDALALELLRRARARAPQPVR